MTDNIAEAVYLALAECQTCKDNSVHVTTWIAVRRERTWKAHCPTCHEETNISNFKQLLLPCGHAR